jgi:hypothetical protein
MKSRKIPLTKSGQKILPQEDKKNHPQKKPSPVTRPVLAEFRQGKSGNSLNLLKTNKSGAPGLQGYVCTAAWLVLNTAEKTAHFDSIRHSVGNVQKLYHGTPATNVAEIAAKGLRPGRKSCMFGSGIYLGTPTKAIGYTYGYLSGAHYLFEVEAALGRVLECSSSGRHSLRELQEDGYDSVAGVAGYTASWGGSTLRHSENVIYSPDQVLVLRVFEYQSTGYSERPTSGRCEIMRPNNKPVPPGSKAFADILTTEECGRTSTMRLYGDDSKHHWACDTCIRDQKLKIGSKIEIRNPNQWKGGRTLTVRVRSAHPVL